MAISRDDVRRGQLQDARDLCRAAMIPKTTATERETARLAGCCHAARRKSAHATSHNRQTQGLRRGDRSFMVARCSSGACDSSFFTEASQALVPEV
jgi:hypothetical protein